jgi:hypothetical protein
MKMLTVSARTKAFLPLLLTIALLLPGGSRADAQSFHRYSVIQDISNQWAHHAIISTRPDAAISGSFVTGCQDFYAGAPVYQTQWAYMSDDAHYWVEIGTGHGCFNFGYWFGGYGWNTNWFPLYTTQIEPAGSYHQFQLQMVDGYFHWRIDATEMQSLSWCCAAFGVAAGLESYDAAVTIASSPVDVLLRSIGGAYGGDTHVDAFTFEAGQVDGTAPMCYHRTAAQTFWYAENAAC